jgi:hypothetical protein
LLAVVGAFVLLSYLLRSLDRRRRRRELVAVHSAFELNDAADADVVGNDVLAVLDGRLYRYTLEQGGHSSPGSTVVTVSMPARLPAFEMHLWSQTTADVKRVARGQEIDVVLGDPTFDASVVVEAAPSSIALLVLDPPTRANVLAQMPCTIDLEDGSLVFRKPGKVCRAADAGVVIVTMRALCARLATVAAEIESERLAGAQGNTDAYRGADALATSAGLADADAKAQAEIARLRGLREEHARKGTIVGGAILAIIFGAVAWQTLAKCR